MITNISLISLAAAMASSPVPPAGMAVRADTGIVSDTAQVLLSSDMIRRWSAANKELGLYWQTHRPLYDSAAKGHDHAIAVAGPGGQQLNLNINAPDYSALAAKDTAIAGVFKRADFPAAQFLPAMLTMTRSLVAVEMARAMNMTVTPDTATMGGKNVAFVVAHKQELTDAGMGVQINTQAAGAPAGAPMLPPPVAPAPPAPQ